MSVQASVQQILQVGTPAVLPSESPSQDFGVVFEDDGQTGYFYALHVSAEGQAIVDALQIYNVPQVQDRERPSTIGIVWAANGKSAALFINDYPHAVFDFESQRGYCRSGFPPSSIGTLWPKAGHTWSDHVLTPFLAS